MMRFYALIAIILTLKMAAIGVVQGRARTTANKFVNPEDAKMFGAEQVAQEVPGVQRAAKAWLNDLENIPIFLILAMVYVIAGLSARAFLVYGLVFTAARILHTFFYLKAVQPWLTIAYSVGALAMFALMIHLFVGFVIVGGD